jgi:hypothetical protein
MAIPISAGIYSRSIAPSEPVSARTGDFMAAGCVEDEVAGVIEIRDPDIDIEHIMSRIRRSGSKRARLPATRAAHGYARLAQCRKKIRALNKELKARMRDYGLVQSHRVGWLRRIDLFVKRTVRKLIQRHVLQQHRIHLKLHTLLTQLSSYLEDEDVNFRAYIDHAERTGRIGAPQGAPQASGRSTAVPG